jgi:hypothetical protein
MIINLKKSKRLSGFYVVVYEGSTNLKRMVWVVTLMEHTFCQSTWSPSRRFR